MNWLRENDKEWLENLKKSQSKGHKQSYENGREIVMPNWIGRKHSEETKKKISESRKKKNNGV